jgi:hypothetical protein
LLEAKLWIARAALDMIDSLSRDAGLTAESFVCNVQSLMDAHFHGAYFRPSWTAFQADRGRHFSVLHHAETVIIEGKSYRSKDQVEI